MDPGGQVSQLKKKGAIGEMPAILILFVVVVIVCVSKKRSRQKNEPRMPKHEEPPKQEHPPKHEVQKDVDLPDSALVNVSVTIGGHDPTTQASYEPEIPPYQGDYAKAVFLSAYAKACPVRDADAYQGYLLYECGIRDCPAFHRQMIDEGYLEESSLEDIVGGQRVVDLKPVLAELHLPVSGRKDVLVKRLLDHAGESFLREKFPEKTFSISEKGRAFLAEHEAYVFLHKHSEWNVSWKEFDYHKKPGLSTHDVLWGIFNKRIIESNDFGRFEYLCMYELLVAEGKRRQALEMLLKIIYIDLSGVEAVRFLSSYTEDQIKQLFNIAILFVPGTICEILTYKDVYEDAMVDHLFDWKLPLNVCSKELFLDMIHSLIDGNFDEDSFLKKLETSFDEAVIPLLKKK